eukprot:TRINITY_DN1701_c0_g1::TRINITY_DN1701_c0_g1_i1::g.17690::m.17690 TRINITY_DN1701_c0_g1::TRINITY_DN1701_c0_g1_i1::g.17690  ORF type:complete len:429 (-),score=111.06,sp/Q54M22/ODBA_DICDI/51.63/4e-144,E1_dh/PF00676.15/1.5e-88,TPP_enzyme_C/PF02775.16/2.3e+03,TPP_enzyme_C/PF02775.16/0.00033,Transketolase_N/PF00456.16/6.9e-05,Transketolase_N/PF00456.16/2.2e+03,DXP_synthase_N/PF13292.1/0.00072,DXP_synthase_N/PF13292.1/1.6e+02 TRINITY_DN1701_c0_g1_i1:276-1562(-)
MALRWRTVSRLASLGTQQAVRAPANRFVCRAFAQNATLSESSLANPVFVPELRLNLNTSVIETFRVMGPDGKVMNSQFDPNDKDLSIKIYETMARIAIMDGILYEAQRQGRLSFYMTCTGEEGVVASAAALQPNDEVFAQYREQAVLLYRGFSFEDFCNQCCSNDLDPAKGRQMPVHYGSKTLHYQQVSSPLGTQIPQAAGAAYAMKINKEERVAMCYFGDGAASEGDFHAALNFAATLECPVIFYCRNNGYAISTPVKDQYRGDGIASRAMGYGMHYSRCDGNDVFAVYATVKKAREFAVTNNQPVLIEAMSYRCGHHSTSDDSTRYRSTDEIEFWKETASPISRLRNYLKARGWWDEDQLGEKFQGQVRQDVLAALAKAENRPKPAISEVFNDVYDKIPRHLAEQQRSLLAHIAKYPEKYSNSGHH